MKVLQIINSSCDTGGAEKLSVQLHQGFKEKGIDSHLLSLEKAPANRREGLYSLRFNSSYHPAVFFRLLRFLRQKRWRDVDVVHVHLFPAQLLVALAARLAGLRAVWVTTEHNTFNRRRKIPGARRVDEFTYALYRKIVCISQGTEQTMREWLPELQPKLLLIPNGVDVAGFAVRVEPEENPERKLVILSAARLTEQKNLSAAVEAIKQIEHENFEYWIAGRGELEEKLQAQVRELGLESKIRFLGFREDLPGLFARADIFLSTSLWEGFGLSIVEAMAAGLPVVVSDVAGVAEVVDKESGCALFVDPSDSRDIAARLEELLGSHEQRVALGRQGRLRAAHFDIRRMVDEYARLYEEMVN